MPKNTLLDFDIYLRNTLYTFWSPELIKDFHLAHSPTFSRSHWEVIFDFDFIIESWLHSVINNEKLKSFFV